MPLGRLALGALALLAAVACGGGGEGGGEAPGGPAAPAPLREGYPVGFPADLPVLPGAQVVSSHRDAAGLVVTLRSTDAPPEVVRYYRQQLVDAGWEIELDAGAERDSMLLARKGERSVHALVRAAEDASLIGLVVAEGSAAEEGPPP